MKHWIWFLLVLFIIAVTTTATREVAPTNQPCTEFTGNVPLPTDVCPSNPPGKTILCHRTASDANPWVSVTVATQSDLLFHLTCHGDFYAGSWVNGTHYDCECKIVLHESPSIGPSPKSSSPSYYSPGHTPHSATPLPASSPSSTSPLAIPSPKASSPSSASSPTPSSIGPLPSASPSPKNVSPPSASTPHSVSPSGNVVPSPSFNCPTGPRCDGCNEGDTSCVQVDCNQTCPNGGVCALNGIECVCSDCPIIDDNETKCKVELCHRDQGSPTYTLNNVSCASVPTHLEQHGDFFPDSVFNATTMVDANCTLVSLPTCADNCTNGTIIVKQQQCDCNELEDDTCVYIDSNVQCPPNVSALCNTDTHTWECEDCPIDCDGNNTVPCILAICTYNSTKHGYVRANATCAGVPDLLQRGSFFPGTLVNGTLLYDENCNLQEPPPPCPKVPRCDCDPYEDDDCTLVECDVQCPNGGECDAYTHACTCSPCGECPMPEPVCGNDIVDQNDEECDGSAHCLENCTLPRAWPYCTILVCDPLDTDTENPPDIIKWFTQHCRCGNTTRPWPTPDELRDECGDYSRTVVCPANLYDTSGLGTWAVVLTGLVFIQTVLAYAGSFL